MVVYNGERFIGEAIGSVLAQDFPADQLEMVIVDDGSTDSTPAILAQYAAVHPGRIRVLRQANAGNTGATNTAIANARGEFLALIDADDVWPADKISRQVELMRARPHVGLVYTDMHVIDAPARPSRRRGWRATSRRTAAASGGCSPRTRARRRR